MTSLVVQGGAIWLGTRSGYIVLLDAAAVAVQDEGRSVKALQYCGEGKVKSIVSVPSTVSSGLKVCMLCVHR